MSPHVSPLKAISFKLFEPLTIRNGTLKLSHRIVLAPLTRDCWALLNPSPTPESPNRTWLPGTLQTLYYIQRTTPRRLLTSKGLPPSIESGAMPGVPGLFCPEQVLGWKIVVDAVHTEGGYIYVQIWHSGRCSLSQHTGVPTVSASASPYDDNEEYAYPLPGTTEVVKYKDFPPIGSL